MQAFKFLIQLLRTDAPHGEKLILPLMVDTNVRSQPQGQKADPWAVDQELKANAMIKYINGQPQGCSLLGLLAELKQPVGPPQCSHQEIQPDQEM